MQKNQKNKYQELVANLPSSVTLVAVSKKRSIEEIKYLYDLGQRDFGENRVEELVEKSIALSDLDIHWHFIGNIQSKKISSLLQVNNLDSIHSVDRLKVLEVLVKHSCSTKLFLQSNISGESQKAGFETIGELKAAYQFGVDNKLNIVGLMGMAAIRTENQLETASENFDRLCQLRDNLNKELELSMGMSDDYKVAIQKGSNYLRIGSLLFS